MHKEKDLTIKYYNDNALKFKTDTIDANMNESQECFLKYLSKDAYILDFGCGAGRDTKYFIEHGLKVDAVDGSIEMCKLASAYTGIDVKHMYFEELNASNMYDGVWACSSILHLPYINLKTVMMKIFTSLKEKGILYTSFKYGDFEGIRNDRYFNDMNETKIHKLLNEIEIFDIVELWVTADVRPGRADEKWLNMILRKKTK